ncbi:diguanylate cyclase (GGDEF) domain-containing protein [Duganella sp. CF402]|uniref:GGDEF domain-containing protein n=1 Tax=unclassified Duganella TaxID=2636909 RepID=UPI0008B94274|nr:MULTISPECIES: GGDEF domain-containing protein [unclassified Duganella]RZT08785.1 diguanylate cyclase (GGDEF)-like protein [Duganella sp. BK701]SEL82120.1 diguanylate cyclase (GGDEF) domain-containing protein [Duganella sp. CF402]
MDSFTLVIVSALASTIMAVTMYLLHRASRRTPCLLDWSAAGLSFLCSNLIALLAMHSQLPFVLAPGIANVFYVGGHYLILAGVRRHLGLRPRYDWLAALAVVILLLHATEFAHGAVGHRLMLLTPFVAAINAAVVWTLRRQPDDAARGSYLPLMVVEAAFMAQLSVRALYLALGQPPLLTFMGNQIWQTAGSLAVLAFLSLANMCCALIVIRHQELALRSASLTDSLTGWLNRRALLDMAEREFQRHRRSAEALHFLTFDIDHFKPINDQHGHAVGDAAIRHVTTVAAQALRGYDARFRIGGEEFAVLITGEGEVRQIGERLRALIEHSPMVIDGQRLTLTVSLGVAACLADDLQWDEALRRADQALYHAKRRGRNRLSVYGEDLLPPAVARQA